MLIQGWAYFQSYETPYQEESFALKNFQKVNQVKLVSQFVMLFQRTEY